MVKTKNLVSVKTLSLKTAKQIRIIDNYYGDNGVYLRNYIIPRLERKSINPLGWVKGSAIQPNRMGTLWLIDTPKGLFFVSALKRDDVDQLFIV